MIPFVNKNAHVCIMIVQRCEYLFGSKPIELTMQAELQESLPTARENLKCHYCIFMSQA